MTETHQDPKLIRMLRGHRESVAALDLSPSCKYIASAGMDSIVFLWNLSKKGSPQKLSGHKSQIHDLKFSPSGNLLVSASNDESLKFWDLQSQFPPKQTTLIKAHHSRIRGLSFSCDGLLLASCGDDKLIKIWSTVDRRLQFSLKKHNNWVRNCQFSPTAINLASCDDKIVNIWNLQKKKQIQSYKEHNGVIHKVKFHSLGNCLASCSHDKKIKLYDLRSQSVIQTYEGHVGAVKSIDFHPTQPFLISSSEDGTTKIWNFKTTKIEYTLQTHSNNTSFSRHGDYFVTGGSQKVIYVWKTGFYDSFNERITNFMSEEGKKQKQLIKVKWQRQTLMNYRDSQQQRILTNNNLSSKIMGDTDQYIQTSQNNKENNIIYDHQQQQFQNSKQIQAVNPQISIKGIQSDEVPQIPPKLVNKLKKIANQLQFITKTTQILQARVINNGQQLRRILQQKQQLQLQ